MAQLISLVIILPLVGFWAWMLHDMTLNDDIPMSSMPLLAWPPRSKYTWMVGFIFLSILTAGYYYCTVYREE